eukprot:1161760-Pelagomonas_calceolata.AAC.5
MQNPGAESHFQQQQQQVQQQELQQVQQQEGDDEARPLTAASSCVGGPGVFFTELSRSYVGAQEEDAMSTRGAGGGCDEHQGVSVYVLCASTHGQAHQVMCRGAGGAHDEHQVACVRMSACVSCVHTRMMMWACCQQIVVWCMLEYVVNDRRVSKNKFVLIAVEHAASMQQELVAVKSTVNSHEPPLDSFLGLIPYVHDIRFCAICFSFFAGKV